MPIDAEVFTLSGSGTTVGKTIPFPVDSGVPARLFAVHARKSGGAGSGTLRVAGGFKNNLSAAADQLAVQSATAFTANETEICKDKPAAYSDLYLELVATGACTVEVIVSTY
jgi:hypothetical protein